MANNETTTDTVPDTVPDTGPGEAAGTAAQPAARTDAKAAGKAANAKTAKTAKAAKLVKTAGKPAPKSPRKATASSARAAKTPAKTPARPSPTPHKTSNPDPSTNGGRPSVEHRQAPVGSAQSPADLPGPGAWLEALREAWRQPGQPPRRLAGLAVAELGPRAAAWAGWVRRTYPGAPALGMARLAAQQARRQTWALAATAAAGAVSPAVHVPATAAVRATLVLRTAAAYGHDPTAPARADDLLELLGAGSVAGPVLSRLRRRQSLTWAVRLLLATGAERDSLERLAHRAARRYRPAPL